MNPDYGAPVSITESIPPVLFEIEYTYRPFASRKIGYDVAGREIYPSTLGEAGLDTSTTATDEFV
jgi:hypothetical protein